MLCTTVIAGKFRGRGLERKNICASAPRINNWCTMLDSAGVSNVPSSAKKAKSEIEDKYTEVTSDGMLAEPA